MSGDKLHRTAIEMTASELWTQSDEELNRLEEDAREQLLAMRTSAAQQGYGRKRFSKKPHYYKIYRRAIARIATIKAERRRAARFDAKTITLGDES